MNLIFCEHAIETGSWDSEEEMLSFLKRTCPPGYISLGEDVEIYEGFYSVVVTPCFGNDKRWGIAVYSEGHGLQPKIRVDDETSSVWLGFNKEVVAISVRNGKVICKIELDHLFNTFIQPSYDKEILLIVHEIGVVALDKENRELWRYSKDIVEDLTLSEKTLKLSFMDSPTIFLDIISGREL